MVLQCLYSSSPPGGADKCHIDCIGFGCIWAIKNTSFYHIYFVFVGYIQCTSLHGYLLVIMSNTHDRMQETLKNEHDWVVDITLTHTITDSSAGDGKELGAALSSSESKSIPGVARPFWFCFWFSAEFSKLSAFVVALWSHPFLFHLSKAHLIEPICVQQNVRVLINHVTGCHHVRLIMWLLLIMWLMLLIMWLVVTICAKQQLP